MLANVAAIKALSPTAVVSVKAPIDADSPQLAERLVRGGVESITFVANHHGRSGAFGSGEFLKESFRRIHTHLVERGLRDLVTLIAAGGIAQAEHMAKIIICGADMVVLDIPFLIALECRMCMNCTKGRPCPVDIADVPADFGARRMTNLGSSWHSQLLEVLGAMGIREVRRLRGEYGRAMFYEDLERETFQALFARREGASQVTMSDIESGRDREDHPRRGRKTPTRFRNAIGKYKVIRTDRCIGCGKCAELCPHGVHVRYIGYSRTVRPKDHLCRGFHCRENCDYYCIDKCPVGALSLGLNPVYETMGDPRWTPDMILSTWDQAENGTITNDTLENRPRQVRRRLRQAAAELPEGAGEEAHREADRHPAQAQQAQGQAGRHRRALVRRRDVLRLGQPGDDGRQGARRPRLEHLHLHRRGRLPAAPLPLRRPT